MTSIELLKEIESWLSFNTEPSKEETAKLRKSIKNHLTEQLRIHDVVGQSEQLVCELCEEPLEKVIGKVCENTMCDRYR
jgi:ElaB/YqjD/DUF883 family membrane-anchored ribosome-binding protein